MSMKKDKLQMDWKINKKVPVKMKSYLFFRILIWI